jgi:hypothetical protein
MKEELVTLHADHRSFRKILTLSASATALVASRRLPTAMARVRTQISSREI